MKTAEDAEDTEGNCFLREGRASLRPKGFFDSARVQLASLRMTRNYRLGVASDCETRSLMAVSMTRWATSHLEDSGTSITSCWVMMVTALRSESKPMPGWETSFTTIAS